MPANVQYWCRVQAFIEIMVELGYIAQVDVLIGNLRVCGPLGGGARQRYKCDLICNNCQTHIGGAVLWALCDLPESVSLWERANHEDEHVGYDAIPPPRVPKRKRGNDDDDDVDSKDYDLSEVPKAQLAKELLRRTGASF